MAKSKTSVVAVGAKRCRPFTLNVMVFSPEAGFKFEVFVEKDCSKNNDAIWKLVFDLFKKNDEGQFDQIVHVSFTAGAPQEQQGVQSILENGVSVNQADTLVNDVFPAAKDIEGVEAPSTAQKTKLRNAMKKVTTVDL